MDISFITAFKKFEGNNKDRQESAVYSWIRKDIPIIAPVNGYTVKGVTGISGVNTAQSLGFKCDSPLINDLILKSLDKVKTQYVALINSDILILDDFLVKLDKILGIYKDPFILGTRFDIRIVYRVDSEETYNTAILEKRIPYDQNTSSDIFIMSVKKMREMAESMPSYILGRYAWDNWIALYGQNKFPQHCLNCTKSLITLHLSHDHQHIEDSEGKLGRKAPSAIHNLLLWGKEEFKYGAPVRIRNWRYTDV